MIIYPAIDLLDGKCVRLTQGKYDQVKVYSEDPAAMAQTFADAGSKWVHIVDLNAAKTGVPFNQAIIAAVAKNTGLKVQTGGGIRNLATLKYLIEEIGVSRCVIGTSAIRDRAFTQRALALFGDKIAIGLDAKNGEIAVDGWTSGSGVNVIDFAKIMQSIGAQTVIYTDIARDGMLTGPATESTRELVEATGLSVIASGGIGSEEDIVQIRTSGCSGVIVGKAIYEGKVRLQVCLQNA
jgi:phosphoribosylformimino-5-aminoimidazole carboxamide ribotide isomerase